MYFKNAFHIYIGHEQAFDTVWHVLDMLKIVYDIIIFLIWVKDNLNRFKRN